MEGVSNNDSATNCTFDLTTKDALAEQKFSEDIKKMIASTGVPNFISLLVQQVHKGDADVETSNKKQTNVDMLSQCVQLLKRSPETLQKLGEMYQNAYPDCTALSVSSPTILLEAETLAWLEFRQVLNSHEDVRLGINSFVNQVRSGQVVLFKENTDEDTIVQSLFPDYKYWLVMKGAEHTAKEIPKLFEIRKLLSEHINNFHKTAGSDDCKVTEVDGPKTEIRKELKDLEARKLHLVTKDLIDELYDFYHQEMLTGSKATTGITQVPNN